MSKVTNNSTKETNPQWLFGGNPNAILQQEAVGQEELCNSCQLPVECESGTKEALQSAGVVFGKPMESDPIFCEATLPTGWKKVATDHSMWSDLVDDSGTIRANIFYKAAFYDRSAFMRLITFEEV